jgi:hypothetical protein
MGRPIYSAELRLTLPHLIHNPSCIWMCFYSAFFVARWCCFAAYTGENMAAILPDMCSRNSCAQCGLYGRVWYAGCGRPGQRTRLWQARARSGKARGLVWCFCTNWAWLKPFSCLIRSVEPGQRATNCNYQCVIVFDSGRTQLVQLCIS